MSRGLHQPLQPAAVRTVDQVQIHKHRHDAAVSLLPDTRVEPNCLLGTGVLQSEPRCKQTVFRCMFRLSPKGGGKESAAETEEKKKKKTGHR